MMESKISVLMKRSLQSQRRKTSRRTMKELGEKWSLSDILGTL
uniref:Uncharacterized protein n=1 Tax=Anguilla anguilla TaxID=7936 RepID=A0A0E9US94_ANGAN